MASSHSVTHWIGQLRAGDQVAAQHLWEGYFRRLVGLARGKLQSLPCRAADEEDVALSAFASFCHGVERGRFPQLADRDDLWRLLVTITARKALHLARDERSQKRGGGRAHEAALGDRDGSAALDAAIDELLGASPPPRSPPRWPRSASGCDHQWLAFHLQQRPRIFMTIARVPWRFAFLDAVRGACLAPHVLRRPCVISGVGRGSCPSGRRRGSPGGSFSQNRAKAF